MEIVVRGRHMDVSDRFRDVATEKLSRLERFGIDIARIDVEVSRERNPRLADRAIEVELNCFGRGPLIRAEAHAGDKMVALEEACDTLTERLRRLADKRRSRRRRHARVVAADAAPVAEVQPEAPAAEAQPEGAAVDDELPAGVVLADGPVLVREKTHSTSPMTVAEALDALESVGHDFFFFYDADVDRPSVLYRRRGFDYGLIRLDVSSPNGRAAS
jgi:ribosomal subunit interface protein